MYRLLVILSALAMSVGWGFRGDYGHEAGAMVPGALLGLSICLASGRPDWWRRGTLLAFLGALGWAFGGQMSYARIVGYTAHTSFPDVAYGYACLFVIGALWGGIGAGILALGLTRRRSELEAFTGPLVAIWLVWLVLDFSGATRALSRRWPLYDSDWVAALSVLLVATAYAAVSRRARPAALFLLLLAAGWIVGFVVLTDLLGLRMTPPRSDNWAGCVGLFAALVLYLALCRDRAALLLVRYGLLAGGIGFAVADLPQTLGRAQWGPIGRWEFLHDLDYWKWMEQGFGLLMGGGVALGVRRLLRDNLASPGEDADGKNLDFIGLLFLLVVMMWENLHKNVRNWLKGNHVPDALFGLDVRVWFVVIGVLLSAAVLVAAVKHRRGTLPLAPASAFGRAQLLFLLLLWIPLAGAFTQAFPGLHTRGVFFVQATFWLTAGVCSLIVVALADEPEGRKEAGAAAADPRWRPGRHYWLICACVPALILLLAGLSVLSHAEPLAGSHLRFGPPTAEGGK